MGSQFLPEYNGGHQEARRRCVVTGGRGFMARHLEWFVWVTDLGPAVELEPGETEELLRDALQDGRAVYSSVDVCSLDELIKDVVFHTAAADPSKDNLELHYKVNVKGTRNVIDACKICNVKRLIYTSSCSVVFDGFHGLFNVNESVPYPDKFPDAYGQTKAEEEKLVLKANSINDLVTCCIRPGNIFGPGDHVIPIIDRYGRIHFILGEGNNYDDFVYVENVVHSHLCAEKTVSTEEGAKISGGKAYFITNMEPVNLWVYFYMVRAELGYKRTGSLALQDAYKHLHTSFCNSALLHMTESTRHAEKLVTLLKEYLLSSKTWISRFLRCIHSPWSMGSHILWT